MRDVSKISQIVARLGQESYVSQTELFSGVIPIWKRGSKSFHAIAALVQFLFAVSKVIIFNSFP